MFDLVVLEIYEPPATVHRARTPPTLWASWRTPRAQSSTMVRFSDKGLILLCLCVVIQAILLYKQDVSLSSNRNIHDDAAAPSAPSAPHDATRTQHNNQAANATTNTSIDSRPFTVDILSVASINQIDLLNAQHRSFSHKSVRNFFNVTEVDDADPDCHTKLTMDNVKAISDFCRRRKGLKLSGVFRYLRGLYARIPWLEQKANPVGWMCAQQRPYSGLMKVNRHYRQSSEELPDYFIIMDDDTYYNMELFQQNFKQLDSSEPFVIAGCLIRHPIHMVNFTFPFGGFGTIISKGAMQNLLQPIYCKSGASDLKCDRLEENLVGEQQYFVDGMNLVELMHRYVNAERYRNVDNWTTGFCMHSDWVSGFFFNYYYVSRHTNEAKFAAVPQSRMTSYTANGRYEKSEIYSKGTGFCNSERTSTKECAKDVDICHRATADWMDTETNHWKLKVPHRFKNVSSHGT